MEARKSQPILKEKCEKSLSNNEMERLAQSGELTSQRGILFKTNDSINGNGVDRRLAQTNNAIPPIEEEINQLARAWCELMLNQLQEACNQEQLVGAIEPKTIENINIDH